MTDARGYDADFYLWTREQAAAIRDAAGARTNLPIDWENVAEEIADLGKSRRNELATRIRMIIEHLLKLELSPARDPRRGWTETVLHARAEIEDLLDESPSLRVLLAELVETGTPKAARIAAVSLGLYGEATPDVLARLAGRRFTVEQVLGDWFSDQPPPSAQV